MGKRARRVISVCTCISPRPSFLAPHSSFCCYEEDVWTAIAKFLGGRSLVMLELANKWFYHPIMDDSIWRFPCLRDLQDWMGIGAFSMESSEALLTEKLSSCPSMAVVTGNNTRR